MLTHKMDGKHKVKVGNLLRKSGYKMKRGGSAFSEAAVEDAVAKGVHQHEQNDHPGTKKTKMKFAAGGCVPGEKNGGRADKKSRLKHGGKSKAPHTKINIMVAPGKSDSAPSMGAAPGLGAMPGAAMARPPMPMSPVPPMGGPPPPMMGMGAQRPPGLKTGGRAKSGKQIGHYDAGAGSGEGREEKIKNYKKTARKS